MTARDATRGQAGFTLIELLVAMTVTLIITGAMYGLLAGGQNAFRREPELTDRQQAIRLGMDRVQRDVLLAGERLGVDSQVFVQGLNNAGTVESPAGGNTDILEFLAAPTSCPDMWVDRRDDPQTDGTGVLGQGNSVNVLVNRPPPACVQVPGLVLVLHDNGATKPAWAHKVPSSDRVNFSLGQQPSGLSSIESSDDFLCGQAQPVSVAGCTEPDQPPERLLSVMQIRYMIWPDTDGIPGLWRSDSAGVDTSGNYVDPPDPAGRWRLIARGVEDLQVQYGTRGLNPTDPIVWNDDPGLVAAGDLTTVVREVRVTLGARTVATNISGARSAANANIDDAIRGQLVSIISPRAALFNLGRADVWH